MPTLEFYIGETVARSIKSVFEFSAERMAAELAQYARLIRSDAATEFPEATPTPMGAVKIGRLTLPARWLKVVAIAAEGRPYFRQPVECVAAAASGGRRGGSF